MKTIQKQQFISFTGIFLCLFWRTADVFGQSYEQSLLTNKEWVNKIEGKSYYSIDFFTDKEWIIKLFTSGGETADGEIKYSYYLSDTVVDEFQHGSVGKSKSGKYIVTLSKSKMGEERLELYEILELTDTTLITKHVRSGTVLEYQAK